MQFAADRLEASTAIRTDLCAIFISLELSRSSWVITSLSPGSGEKMSKHTVRGGDVAGLLKLFAQLREKAKGRTGKVFPLIVIQEAGLDGFWIDRVLQNEGIESHVVDPASIATSRRRRRAKTDGIDGEALVRALLAYKRGEPRVCSMVRLPTPEDEDRRRLCRERKVLTMERVQHVNRIKGLLFSQGVSGYEPLRRDRRGRLDALQTGDGRPLPQHLKAQICRELDRIELLLAQIKAVEAERDALLAAEQTIAPVPPAMLHLPIGQSATANDDDPARLVMAAPSAGLGARPLVPRPRKTQRWPPAQDDDRGGGAKATRRPLEICDRWHRHRRSRDEDRLTIGSEPIP